jgi:hypothetical protein
MVKRRKKIMSFWRKKRTDYSNDHVAPRSYDNLLEVIRKEEYENLNLMEERDLLKKEIETLKEEIDILRQQIHEERIELQDNIKRETGLTGWRTLISKYKELQSRINRTIEYFKKVRYIIGDDDLIERIWIGLANKKIDEGIKILESEE